MRTTTIGRLAVAALATGATFAAARTAAAADCSTYPNPVYIAGSTAVRSALYSLGTKLQALGITVIYQGQGSCTGLGNFTSQTALTGTANAVDGNTNPTCTIGTPTQMDIGASDVFPSTCPNITLSSSQKDFQGPIQAMTFVVPGGSGGSNETSISDDAAYVVEGWGGSGQYTVSPWTVPSSLHVRGPGSGTESMIGVAIGLVASKWAAVAADGGVGTTLEKSGGTMATDVAADANKAAALGILSTGDADANRATLKILAFKYKAGGQQCGYLPDSTSTAFDKINVRQGRYAIWGPFHAVANVDNSGVPQPAQGNPAGSYVATVMKYITNDASLVTADQQAVIDAQAKAHVIPACSMQVQRTSEIGAPAAWTPDAPCGCYFESKVGTASSSCKTCSGDGDCSGGTPKCRFGYCEVK